MTSTFYLAAWETPEEVIEQSGTAWTIIENLFAVVGIGIVLFVLWKAITGFARGADGKLFRTLGLGILAAILCFEPMLPVQLVSASTSLVRSGLCTIQVALDENASCETGGGGGGNGGSGGASDPVVEEG